MTRDRWQRIQDLFHAAQERHPDDRAAFLAEACADDHGLLAEVESLLRHERAAMLDGGLTALVADIAGSTSREDYRGERIGPYVLDILIGRGGMSDVYRARDERLGRDVAVKVLPEDSARQPERLGRFEREARVLAALNHPNIGTIHGVESGRNLRGIVLELVDGPTLADMLKTPSGDPRPLPVPKALEVAVQVARALEAAHQKGVIHRDLKPANIKVTPDGTVKVLDFGVAKIEMPEEAGHAAPDGLATVAGAFVGTAAYMSPEQARGGPVDRRTDIWAFGCVLFETLTGHRPFSGDTRADVVNAILGGEPDWSRLPLDTPARVGRVLRRTLAKDVARRLHHIADARIEIEDAQGEREAGRRGGSARPGFVVSRTAARWTGVAVVAVAAAAGWFVIRPDSSLSSPLRVSVELPGDVSLNAIGRGSSVAVSPDGQHVVFVATVNGETRLFDRSLTSGVNAPIAGTEGGTNPFFSPDGRWIGFWTEGQIRKVPATGGIVTTVVNQASFLGAAWAADDTIVFASDPSDGLWRVSADGGRPTRVTSRASGELNHSWPEILPNGDLLFTTWNNTGFDGGRIAVQGSGDNAPTVLVERASYGRVASVDGRSYLVFARPEGLLAAPLDLREKRLAAPPVPVLDGVLCNLSGGANFSLSAAGVLAYVPGGLDEASKTLLWVDQTGSAAELPTISGIGFQYSLSPDGGRIARPNANGPDRDLWVDDLSGRRASVRLTYDEIVNVPVWTRDGQRVIYGKGVPATNLFWRAADGSGDEERLTSSPNLQIAGSVSADGTLLYIERHQQRGFDIYALPLVGPRTPRLFIGTVSYEGSPVFSPDGHWVAYQSDLSGRAEIYVASFPDASVRIRVSVGGGHAPAWSADGRHLYFRTDQPQRGGGDMTIVAVDTTGPEPLIGMPRVLFSEPYQGGTQVGPDGRFLLLKQTTRESSSRAIQLVLNWFDDVRKVLPR